MSEFKKGDLIQLGTGTDVYEVTRDETARGLVYCRRNGKAYRFHNGRDDVNYAQGEGS
jgi:hypothetical protein